MAKQWEYTEVSLAVQRRKDALDSWGNEGWELVSVIQDSAHQTIAFFKREKYTNPNHMRVRSG